MRRVLEAVVVVVLVGCAGAVRVAPPGEKTVAPVVGPTKVVGEDAQLAEARAVFDEEAKLEKAGKYAEAIPWCERALALREAALGKEHPDVAATVNELAWLYHAQGQFDRAEPLFQRALTIREAVLGKNHPDVAETLNNLATLYLDQGQFGRAEPLHQRALAIFEAALGKEHPNVAVALNNLADLYLAQGQYDRVEPLHQRALRIMEAALGKSHPQVAISLNNLAVLYVAQGRYDRAEPLHQRALRSREAALGKEHPAVAGSLNSLAELYRAQGQYGRAEPLYQRALAIYEVALGKSHPLFATSLNNLALLYYDQRQYGRAEPLYLRALAIREAALGKEHPRVVTSLTNLGWLHLARHRLEAALPLLTRALTVSETHSRREVLDLSESRREEFLQRFRDAEWPTYALLRAHPDEARVRRLALAAALLRKGRSAEEAANISRTIYRSLGAQDHETFERLRGLRTQLAKLSLGGPGKLTLSEYQQSIKDLADRGDALEVDLAKRSAPLRALTALPHPDVIVDRVAASLPPDAALVELLAYMDKPLVPKPGASRAKIPSQLRYAALVLFHDGRTRAVDLGPAAPIDSATSRLRDALASRDAAWNGPARDLYKLAFKPLLPLLADVRRLFISPDGQLNMVPFAALHDGKRFLADTFDFTYLTSGKELLPRPDDTPPAHSVVVLADPDFNTSPAAPPTSASEAPVLAERSYPVERFFSTLRADFADQPWVPLPGTRQEAEALQRLFPQAQLFLGRDASKERLLHLERPGILHVATHGFFLEDAAASSGSRGVAASGPLGGERLVANLPDPLLRSGLVLAGARASGAGDGGAPSLDGSLVTALELAGLDLWGTELVVLSACDTGRGDVKLGQGVYGLRRALVVAGAETVVMSLWKVNDETTRTLMEGYYHNLLAGKSRVAALREAMLALRQQQPHPHFWAPFIAIGKDAPLRGTLGR